MTFPFLMILADTEDLCLIYEFIRDRKVVVGSNLSFIFHGLAGTLPQRNTRSSTIRIWVTQGPNRTEKAEQKHDPISLFTGLKSIEMVC